MSNASTTATPIVALRTLPVAVIGLGYVGLPLAVALARVPRVAAPVVGYDIDAERVDEIRSGRDRTGEVDAATLRNGTLSVTANLGDLAGTAVYIVTAPTPVDEDNRPDLAPLLGACRTVGAALALKPRAVTPPIVVFESTVYPGITEDICGPAVAVASGLVAGRDFFLGYSPERINPGDRTHTVDRVAKVVAGSTPAVTTTLARLYGAVTEVYVARDIRTAEAAKVIENAQRDINIAFINEVAMIFNRLGMSIYDVLAAARTKWNFLDFRPGLVGGHCIGVDPFYLAHFAQSVGHDPEVILAGRRINDAMGDYLAERVDDEVSRALPALDGNRHNPRTLVLGLTFKENVPDLRNSKVVDLVRGLEARGHIVDVHDPRADPATARELYGIRLLAALPERGGYDGIVGAVDHDLYRRFAAERLASLLRPGGVLADIKGIWRGLALPEEFRRWEL